MVQEGIIYEVKASEHFSVMADETKDASKKEQMSLVVRYYYDGVVQESFLEYLEAEHLDAVQKEMFSGPPRELQRLSDTRWACRYIACRNLMDRLTAVIRVLEEISDEPNPTRAVEARGLLCQIDIKFIALLTVFRKVLGDTKLLSDMLQSSKIDLCKAIDLIETLRQTLEEYRNEGESFNELWNTVIETCDNCNISKVIKQKRATQTASRLDDGVVTSTLGQRTQVDSKEAFRVNIFLPIINSMIGEMEKRFSKSNLSIMREYRL
ncbi:hypothetical protein F7725_018946 [Dissostichus mawsoni]|uniref:DUF4371 domain-containing protein n=1 Tax=Dissostichus mawsoni TaxID=36200 RepID=A0A7J5XUR9_DISMA|nr:hypothetical protein F7725_018946 [Dissostichus mawsoni]